MSILPISKWRPFRKDTRPVDLHRNDVLVRCEDCRHRARDRAVLERMVPGLDTFGSAYGASVGASRLCRLHDRLTSPHDGCRVGEPRHIPLS